MKKDNDDFAWLIQRLESRRNRTSLTRNRTYRRERFETVDEIVERRRRRPSVLLILLQLLPFLVAILLILLR